MRNRGAGFGKILNLFNDSLMDSVGVFVAGVKLSAAEFAFDVSIHRPSITGVEALLWLTESE